MYTAITVCIGGSLMYAARAVCIEGSLMYAARAVCIEGSLMTVFFAHWTNGRALYTGQLSGTNIPTNVHLDHKQPM